MEHTQTTYQFNKANPKAFWFLLLIFAGIPFIFLLPHDVGMWAFFALIFSPMILAFVFLIKCINKKEVIQLHQDYFNSKL